MIVFSILLALLQLSQTIADDRESSAKLKRSMLEQDPCLDAEQVQDLESVEFLPRFSDLGRPWLRRDVTPKVYTSGGLQYQWMWAKSLPVKGLRNGTTASRSKLRINLLDAQNCSFLAIGDVVWKSLQMAKPLLIEGEVSCSIQTLYSKCLRKFGDDACGLYPINDAKQRQYRLEIGDAKFNRSIHTLRADPLMLYDWGTTLNASAVHWSYTVTSMAIYDNNAGHVYLVDMTGRGYTDTCERRLIAAVDDTKWKDWAEDDPLKLYRFYWLRALGFGVANHDLQKFVNNAIDDLNSKEIAQTFYCETVLKGVISWAGSDVSTACHLVFPDNPERRRIAHAKEIMQEEMGNHWANFMAEMVDDIEAVYLTERQFVEVRNRIKGRRSAEVVNTAPGVLQLGEPLAVDISDVHRRPILTRSKSADAEMPREFVEVPEVESGADEPDLHDAYSSLPMGAGYDISHGSSEANLPKRDTGSVPNSDEDDWSTTGPPRDHNVTIDRKEPEAVAAQRVKAQLSSDQSHSRSVDACRVVAGFLFLLLLR
ncbi:hypothetical protein Q1695_010972 [Nippostrongylus brasiliensis]|nr:hypothetical protein Q1695_010972 [Nippostrongylus brasiliensis]